MTLKTEVMTVENLPSQEIYEKRKLIIMFYNISVFAVFLIKQMKW